MTRIMRFRGRSLAGEGFIYGYHVVKGVDTFIVDSGGTYYRVDPHTVGQYTGRQDKNGLEIYEGDILNDGAVVEWFDTLYWDGAGSPHPGFYCKKWLIYPGDDNDMNWHDGFNKETEIVGTVHSNPELLK